MIRKYPGQNIPPDPPLASNIPKLHWIQIISDTLKVITSPPRQDTPETTDYYYNTTYINTELNAIKARLTALETRATSLEGRATVVEGRATTLETGLATTNTNLATTNTNLATTNTNLTTTNTNLTTTNTKVGVIEGIVNPPVITSYGSNYNKTTGSNFTYQITASNTPTSYGASGLPSGLSVNSAGYISGTITAGSGSFTVTVSATNIGGTGTRSFTITVT